MKIAPKAVESFLAKPQASARACLLYGPDSGLARERMGRIKAAALSGSDDPFAYVEFSEAALLADPAKLTDELGAMSLLGSTIRMIVIRDASDKCTKILEEAAGAFHVDALVVVMAGELSPRSSLRALFEKEPAMAAIACYKDEARDVSDIVRKDLVEAGVRLEAGGVEYLASQLGNDRYVTRQEIQKIITYAGEEKVVSLADLRALVGDNRDTELDDFVGGVADRSLAALDFTLMKLMREGISAVTYLRALQRYFNRLYGMQAQVAAGQSIDQVIASARPPIFFRQQPAMTRHLREWNIPQIARALELLIEAETACKTSDLPPTPAVHRKLMQLTQIRERSAI